MLKNVSAVLNEIVIKVENVSKVYQKRNHEGNMEEFYALKDINFEVKKGEVVGIIGKNGSGKSTLLKILSGVTKPTTGRVEINGTVASILDVGTGFHQDLSGKENVYLRGKLLGMSTKEIDETYEDIVNFSEIGEFIDTPVKNYSSGMFLRLAFSILVFLKCDILLLDEVMVVGDIGFREKCDDYIKKISQKKTIIEVTHQIDQTLRFHSKLFFLKNGTGTLMKPQTENVANVINEIKHKVNTTITPKSNKNFYVDKDSVFNNNIVDFQISFVKNENKFNSNEDIYFTLNNKILTSKKISVCISLKDIYSTTLFEHHLPILKKITKHDIQIPSDFLNSGQFKIDLIYYSKKKIEYLKKDAIQFEVKTSRLINNTMEYWGLVNSPLKIIEAL